MVHTTLTKILILTLTQIIKSYLKFRLIFELNLIHEK